MSEVLVKEPVQLDLKNLDLDVQVDGAAWHEMPVAQCLKAAESRDSGLSSDEALERLERFGRNRLAPPAGRSNLQRMAEQFHNVLIYVLLGAAAVTGLLGHWIDMSVILGVVILNALIGFVQEGKAEQALEAIRSMLSPQAAVLRDGRRLALAAEELVPGDIVFLQSGDRVPADLRLIQIHNLSVQEAVLTGESVPVQKSIEPVDAESSLGDRICMAYSGTMVVVGQASGVVISTGETTEIGRISTMLAEVQRVQTPLMRQLSHFSRWLSAVILAVAAVTYVFGVSVRSYPLDEMFLAVVGLAVSWIPEGLPAIMTITLAIGVQRMARRNAIVRRLPAVETLGSVSVICTDKTGTLTRNEMTVRTVCAASNCYEVTGTGYAPVGNFLLDGQSIEVGEHAALQQLIRAGLLCSDAQVRLIEGHWQVIGDPTEGALVTAAMRGGLDPQEEFGACPRTDLIPFESEQLFMATLHHDHQGHGYIYAKGAMERLLPMCSLQLGANGPEPIDAGAWHARLEQMASRGERVLAFCMRSVGDKHRSLRFSDLETDLVMLGVCGQADPPREEARLAIDACQAAGIRVKMITGDHAVTARAIGRELGLLTDNGVLRGVDLDALSDAELRERVQSVDVFARTSPEHKLRLVEALQGQEYVVAMTGDGVNDAPALKRADVGVAMGRKGTEAAKEAAEMVLADDNFASISNAVEEGRTVYSNLCKAIVFILPTSAGEGFTIMAAVAMGMSLPITAVQILWINMITTVTLALALAFEPPEPGVMQDPPRDPHEPLLSRFLVWRIVLVSLILVAGTFGLYLWEIEHGAPVELARTVAVNVLVMFEVFYLFNTRYLRDSALCREGLIGSRPVLISVALVILLQLAFTYAPPLQYLFASAPMDGYAWLRVIGVAFTVFLLVELEKTWLRARRRRDSLA